MGEYLKKPSAEDCCDFPSELYVQKGALSSDDCLVYSEGGSPPYNNPPCVEAEGGVWSGLLTDFYGDRCIYRLSYDVSGSGTGRGTGPDQFDSGAGIEHVRTSIHRSRLKECGWFLHIACSHCNFHRYIWAGFRPNFQPWGEYRVLHGCNMGVETMQVNPPDGFVDYFNP